MAFERDNLILSPFDNVLHKQLVDYEVERVAQNGKAIYVSENEHFVDALGLSYLAMVLEFKELTNVVKDPQTATIIKTSNKGLGQAGINSMMKSISSSYGSASVQLPKSDDHPGDRQRWVKVSQGYSPYKNTGSAWGSRSGGRSFGRSGW